MPVPKPDEMSSSYRHAYWRNWWKMLTKQPVDRTLTGRCVGCGKRGVLGYDLIHRGMPLRTTNLLCTNCCEDDDHGESDKATSNR